MMLVIARSRETASFPRSPSLCLAAELHLINEEEKEDKFCPDLGREKRPLESLSAGPWPFLENGQCNRLFH